MGQAEGAQIVEQLASVASEVAQVCTSTVEAEIAEATGTSGGEGLDDTKAGKVIHADAGTHIPVIKIEDHVLVKMETVLVKEEVEVEAVSLTKPSVIEVEEEVGAIVAAIPSNPCGEALGDMVPIGLNYLGRRKLVRHLGSTAIGDIIPDRIRTAAQRLVVVDREGFEVGRDVPLGVLARQSGMACPTSKLLELTIQTDEWGDSF